MADSLNTLLELNGYTFRDVSDLGNDAIYDHVEAEPFFSEL